MVGGKVMVWGVVVPLADGSRFGGAGLLRLSKARDGWVPPWPLLCPFCLRARKRRANHRARPPRVGWGMQWQRNDGTICALQSTQLERMMRCSEFFLDYMLHSKLWCCARSVVQMVRCPIGNGASLSSAKLSD